MDNPLLNTKMEMVKELISGAESLIMATMISALSDGSSAKQNKGLLTPYRHFAGFNM